MEQIAQILNNILDTLVLSGGLQKFNNLQHYQLIFNSDNFFANNIKLTPKTTHSLSINIDQVNINSIAGSFNLIIDDVKICYKSNLTIEATTLFDKDITIEVLPNTILTIIKQY